MVILCGFLGFAGSRGFCQEKDEASGLHIQVPESGPLTRKVKQLWQTTRPIIEADARANQSDAYYQARRTPMFTAWVRLQMDNSIATDSSEDVSRLIPRILEVIDHVYGFPGFSEAQRVAQRKNAGRTAYLIKDIDRRLSKLP
jgi:hypothetical protein